MRSCLSALPEAIAQQGAARKAAFRTAAQWATDLAMKTLEEKIAHLERLSDEMSEVIARQDKEIALLTRRVQMLMEAEAERQRHEGEHIFGGNERPPHY